MNEHWKTIQWLSLALVAAAIVALVNGWYFVVFGLFFAAWLVALVVGPEWARRHDEEPHHVNRA